MSKPTVDCEPMVFESLEPIEIKVSIAGKDYLLREASEQAARVYRNASIAGARLQDGSLSEMPGDMAGVQSLLLSYCLFHVNDRGIATKAVDRKVILGWLSRVVKPLFEKAKEISELGEEEDTPESLNKQKQDIEDRIAKLQEEDSAKNEPGATAIG